MKKTVKVVMLPTEKASSLYLNKAELKYTGEEKIALGNTNQHLYLVSDDEIKEGDWFLHPDNVVIKANSQSDHKVYRCKKIIATTDKSLDNVEDCSPKDGSANIKLVSRLPQIPKSFVEQYVKAPIDEVELEYDTFNVNVEIPPAIRLTYNNEVIIHNSQIKTYTREEVKTILKKYMDYAFGKEYSKTEERIDQWMEENLLPCKPYKQVNLEFI